jgi:hypothetical protein
MPFEKTPARCDALNAKDDAQEASELSADMNNFTGREKVGQGKVKIGYLWIGYS